MSLSMKAIDRLFERLSATYGNQWNRMWSGIPIADVKTSWAHELGGFERDLQPIAWALENLPEKAPNVIEFRNLARKAPTPELKQLPAPKADPSRVAAELAKLATVRADVTESAIDHKAWAKRLIARHNAGEKLMPISLRFAREALNMKEIHA